MTSRLNLTVISIVVGSLVLGAALVGGLWFLQDYRSAERNIQRAEEAMNAGDLDMALRYYGRAVDKDPANLEYLNKLEQTLLQTRPATPEAARDRYGMRLGVLRQKADHYPTDAAKHLRLIREYYDNARLVEAAFGRNNGWSEVRTAAENMWTKLPESNEKRIQAKLYSGMASTRLVGALTDSQVQQGLRDLETYVEQHPDDQRGWAALVRGRLLLAERTEQTGSQQQIQSQWQRVQEDLESALQAAPNGPHVAYVRAMYYTRPQSREYGDVNMEMYNQAFEHLAGLVDGSEHPWLLLETASILRLAPNINGTQKAIDRMQTYLNEHPEAHAHRLTLANLYSAADDLDQAEQIAREVMTAEPAPLSFLSRMQFDLRRYAASVVTDIAFERWRNAEDAEQRQQRLAELQDAVDQLAERSKGAENDPLLAAAEARVAFAAGEYQRAAARLERLTSQGVANFNTYRLAVIALENANQPGLAYDRVNRALELRPTNLGMLHKKAQLELRMRRPDNAADTLEQALEYYPGHPSLEALASEVQRQREDQSFDLSDPDVVRIAEAQRQMDGGDIDGARETLQQGLEQTEQKLQFLMALIRLEMSAGNRQQAKTYLQQAREIGEGHSALHRLSLLVDDERDPVEAIRSFIENAPASEADRAIETAVNMGQLARSRENLAASLEQAGESEQAESARQIAQRARRQEQEALELAEQLAPDDPQLIGYLFEKALHHENWSKASDLARRAEQTNADDADGLIYRGRLALAQENWEAAARALQDAVSRNSVLSEAWRGLAFAYQRLGNFTEALGAYEEAYRRNPAQTELVKRYCGLLQQTGDVSRALRIARQSQGLARRDREFREMWLSLEASQGDRAMALQRRRELYRNNPDDQRNATALVSMLIELEPQRSLLLDEDDQPQFHRAQWNRMGTSTQRQHLREAEAEWHEEAARILGELEQDEGRTIQLALLRARLLRDRGRPSEGEAVLQDFIDGLDDTPEKARMMISLAEYQQQTDQPDAALATLQQASAYQGDDRSVDSALGSLYFNRGAFEQALEHYQRASEASESATTRQIKLRLVECLIRLERFDQAEQRLSAIKSEHGDNLTVTLLEASILRNRAERLYEQGDLEAARVKMQENKAVLNVAEQINPTSPLPHVERASALFNQYQHTENDQLLEQALRSLDRAEQLQAGHRAARILRLQIHRERGAIRRLTTELTDMVESSPDNKEWRHRLIQVHAQQGNLRSAIEVAREGTRRQPQQAMWYEILGELYAQHEDRRTEALQAYLQAYSLAGRPDLLKQYMSLANEQPLAPQSFDFRPALQAVSQHREHVQNDPIIQAFVAQMLYVQNQRTNALQQLQQAYQRIDRSVEQGGDRAALDQWFTIAQRLFRHEEPQVAERTLREIFGDAPRIAEMQLLASLWMQTGESGWTRAGEIVQHAIDRAKQAPDERRDQLLGSLYRNLGTLRYQQGQVEQAVQAYEQALEHADDDPHLLNNLAYMLAEQLDQADQALPYAERAIQLLPDNPSILDTLGWVQYKVGQVEAAEQNLRKSLERRRSAGTHVRLAQLLAETGRPDEALEHLDQAEQNDPDQATQTEIDRLVDDIRTKTTADR